MKNEDILRTRENAVCLFTLEEIEHAMDAMAHAISAQIGDSDPLVLAIMTGGMVPAAMLLARLNFPLQLDYIHLTRYGENTSGGDLSWVRPPPANLAGRTVLLVDDLLDHGVTLQSAKARCLAVGALEVFTAVLVVKTIARRQGLEKTDFHALETEDRYLFGAGMDYKTYWRNGAGIFAVGS